MDKDEETTADEKPPPDFEDTVQLFTWKLTEEERLRSWIEGHCWW